MAKKAALAATETNDNESEAAISGTESSTRPVVTFSGSGGIRVAVWKNKNESGVEHYSIKMERNYRDDAGEFHATPYLGENDLLRAQKLLGEADAWIEQDRQRYRQSMARER